MKASQVEASNSQKLQVRALNLRFKCKWGLINIVPLTNVPDKFLTSIFVGCCLYNNNTGGHDQAHSRE